MSNSITAGQLAAGAAAANLATSGQSGVPGGGMVLSSNDHDANLRNAGYVRMGKVDLGDVWEQRDFGSAPAARRHFTAVWTGTELIVWGGYNGEYLNNGGRYDLAANTWKPIATNGAPTARSRHTAVWTGTEMVVWGGYAGAAGGFFGDGGRYNPVEDRWTAVTTARPYGSMDRRGDDRLGRLDRHHVSRHWRALQSGGRQLENATLYRRAILTPRCGPVTR